MNLFDKEIVEAFKRSVAVYPNGLSVDLNDHKIGVIVRQHKHLCDRPIVRIMKDELQRVISPYEIDLSKCLSTTIKACFHE